MPVHHAIQKKAQKAGIILTDLGDDEDQRTRFKAHWPEYNQVMFGPEAKYLLDDMLAVKTMRKSFASFNVVIEDDDTVSITIRGTGIEVKGMRAAAAYKKAVELWQDSRSDLDIEDEEEDNEVQEEIEAEAREADEEERVGGSVVSTTYRAKYAEAGHPNTCGDWLANILNDYCLNKEGFSIEQFEPICAMNGVDLSKYNRETRGWQGRLRMTGRNLLGRRIALKGVLVLPDKEVKVDAEWLAAQKYQKPKAPVVPTTPKLAPKSE